MSSSREHPTTRDPALARFLERVQKSFSHDLRTPLGTIVNYAAVLEANQGADAEEVRDLGRRIRANAQRASRMVQLLANAAALASRPLRPTSTDLLALLRSVLTDAGGRSQVHLAQTTRNALADVDAEVLGFAWRAYVAVESDALGKPIDEATVQVAAEGEQVLVELSCGGDSRPRPPLPSAEATIDLSAFLRHDGGPARLECSLWLALAQELVITHGGDLQVFGRPGARSGLRVRFPAMI